jgi:hypothetical protein
VKAAENRLSNTLFYMQLLLQKSHLMPALVQLSIQARSCFGESLRGRRLEEAVLPELPESGAGVAGVGGIAGACALAGAEAAEVAAPAGTANALCPETKAMMIPATKTVFFILDLLSCRQPQPHEQTQARGEPRKERKLLRYLILHCRRRPNVGSDAFRCAFFLEREPIAH